MTNLTSLAEKFTIKLANQDEISLSELAASVSILTNEAVKMYNQGAYEAAMDLIGDASTDLAKIELAISKKVDESLAGD